MTVSSETAESSFRRPRRAGGTSLCLLLVVLLFACGEGESEFFDPGSTRDLDAPLDTLDHVVLLADRTYRERGETGSRSTLPIVRDGDLTTTAYLRFALDDLPDTSSIVEGRISFRVIGGSGDPVRLQLFEVDPAAPAWVESDLPLDGLPILEPFLDSQATPVVGTPGMDPAVTPGLSIPASLIRRWKNDPESNRGVAVRLGTGSTGFLVVSSSEAVVTDTDDDGTTISVKTPELVVQRSDQDYTFEPEDDAYIVQGGEMSEGADATTLWVEQLVPHRALFLPSVPDTFGVGATIHKAELFLQLVPGSFTDTLDLSVGVYRTLDPWTEDVEPDTLGRETFANDVVTVTSESDSLRFDFAPQLQRWLDGEDNLGLMVRVIGEGAGDGGFRVFSSEAAAENAPYVRIIWSPAPDPRWEDR